MIDTASAISLLTADEGVRLQVYDDATGLPIRPGSHVIGHPTIGTGRALDTHGISQAENAALLQNDLAAVEAALAEYAWFVPLDPVRQLALACMAFQLGVGGLLHFPAMLAAVAQADWPEAATECLDSKWASQTPARAIQVGHMLATGQMPAIHTEPARPAQQETKT